jgi:hypothetical protein
MISIRFLKTRRVHYVAPVCTYDRYTTLGSGIDSRRARVRTSRTGESSGTRRQRKLSGDGHASAYGAQDTRRRRVFEGSGRGVDFALGFGGFRGALAALRHKRLVYATPFPATAPIVTATTTIQHCRRTPAQVVFTSSCLRSSFGRRHFIAWT